MPRDVHLVGSVPGESAAEVFEKVSAALGPHLKRIPDGETGERADWIVWLEPVFANSPALEKSDELFRIREMPNMGALKITIQQFYRPGGDSTQNRGVVSDVELPSLTTQLDVGESDLDYALAFIALVQFANRILDDISFAGFAALCCPNPLPD